MYHHIHVKIIFSHVLKPQIIFFPVGNYSVVVVVDIVAVDFVAVGIVVVDHIEATERTVVADSTVVVVGVDIAEGSVDFEIVVDTGLDCLEQ